ncbi:MAG: Lrp/AsnC family transcriptional regulator [Nitrososphaera sp.]|nr:Lrp/AsnC family transcriptional regulator [Nitrososphaera sp.]
MAFKPGRPPVCALPFIAGAHNLIMTLAFVLLNCDIGSATDVIGQMRQISGVSEAMGVSGIYDIVAKLHANSNGGITGIIRQVQTIASVRSCSTMIVAEQLDNWQVK